MDGLSVQKRIGARVKMIREQKRMLQKDTADALHISLSAYSKLEAGDRGISSENCVALADLFGVSCDYILRGVETENIDICTSTCLMQATIQHLKKRKQEENKIAELREHCQTEADKYAELVAQTDNNDLIHEYVAKNVSFDEEDRLYEIKQDKANVFSYMLNAIISDDDLWNELEKAGYDIMLNTLNYYAYRFSDDYGEISDLWHERRENEFIKGVFAARYVAGEAFARFFSSLCKDPIFFRCFGLSEVEEKQATEQGFLNKRSDTDREG